jgi:transposase-like protein
MGRKKTSGRPKTLRAGKPNMVAAAVELAGGITAVANLCGVSRQAIYLWIQEWRVERLVDALRLSRASGVPIERLAGVAFDPDAPPQAMTRTRTGAKPDSD